MNIRLWFGIISVVIGSAAYYFYISDIFSGKTKPHAFSWLIWGLLAANGFIAQVHARAGFGTWAIALTSVANLLIFGLAIFKGDNQPTRVDWLLLGLGLFSFILLFAISNKTIGVWVTIWTLCIGFAITIKKSIHKPNEETGKAYLLNALKFVPSIAALSSFSFLTVGYPLTALFGNAAIIGVIYFCRKHTKSIA